MKILVVSATRMETNMFRESYEDPTSTGYQGKEIIFLFSGIGILSTAARLTTIIEQASAGDQPFDLIIQAGIAGSFDRKLPLGSVYRVSSEVVADMGVLEDGAWKDVFDMGLEDSHAKPYQHGRLLAPELNDSYLAAVGSLPAITVNQVTTDNASIKRLIDKYNPSLESMEGAALHFVALENNIPFLQLRAVSNYVGERNKANWKMKEAIVNLNEILSQIIQHLVL